MTNQQIAQELLSILDNVLTNGLPEIYDGDYGSFIADQGHALPLNTAAHSEVFIIVRSDSRWPNICKQAKNKYQWNSDADVDEALRIDAEYGDPIIIN